MYGLQTRNRRNAASEPGSPAVGEIDTKAPFESVKAALNLFVEPSPKPNPKPVIKKSKPKEESVLGKETQLHWILKEIDKYKENVTTAESAKGQALGELEKANNTFQELTNKIDATTNLKQASVESTEAAKARAQQLEQLKSTNKQENWQQSVEKERNMYKAAANQLIPAKQQLNNLKQDFDIAMEAKLTYIHQAEEAQESEKVNREKIDELSNDIAHMNQNLERVKFATAKAEEDHARLMEEKDDLLDSKNKAHDDIELEIQRLKEEEAEEDPENLEKKLEETTEVVNVLRDQLKGVQAADMELLRNVELEIKEAEMRLEEMKEEERSIRGEVESLKQELENVTNAIKSVNEEDNKKLQLQSELDGMKQEIEEAMTQKTIVTDDVRDLESQISEMSLEAEKARQKEDEMNQQVEILLKEAQRSEMAIKEAEEKLQVAQREVEQAEAAKELADDQIRKQRSSSSSSSSSGKDYDRLTDSESDNTVVLTTKDFEALSKKTEEATVAADAKVEAIMCQLETIKQKERGILEKLEKSMQENKETEVEITKAQRAVDLADAARHTLETELNKWRQQAK